MAGAGATYEIGSDVFCSDSPCGELLQFVIDPVPRHLTRLIVFGPRERTPHVVPLGLARPTDLGVLLSCDQHEYERLRSTTDPALPTPPTPTPGSGAAPDPATVPEMRIRRGDRAHAADGDAGRITGLVVRPEDGLITHVLLARRHRWPGRHRTVPAELVVGFGTAGVTVGLTRRQIEELPETA